MQASVLADFRNSSSIGLLLSHIPVRVNRILVLGARAITIVDSSRDAWP